MLRLPFTKSLLIGCLVVLSALAFLSAPSQAVARIGVGVGTGKIQLEEELLPGTLYELPSITVINTGDQTGQYELDITYHEQQPEQRPDKAWFIFSPEEFSLDPGQAQEVKIKLGLPVKTIPGDYFAYLEARPLATSDGQGGASIGIAAASKLYFSVQPANIWQGMWYRAKSLWDTYRPFPQIAVGTILILAVVKVISSKVSFSLSVQPKKTDKPAKKETDHHETE